MRIESIQFRSTTDCDGLILCIKEECKESYMSSNKIIIPNDDVHKLKQRLSDDARTSYKMSSDSEGLSFLAGLPTVYANQSEFNPQISVALIESLLHLIKSYD